MSFLNKLKDGLKELMGDDKDKKTEAKPGQGHSTEGQKDFSHNQPPQHSGFQQNYQGPPPTQNYGQSPQQGYGPPPSQNYGQPPSQGYGQPPSHGYGQPPQGHGPPQQGSNLPPGWVQQWDAQSQRWYYLEQNTGRSQWEPPMGQHGQDRGYGGPPGSHGYAPVFGQQDHGQAPGHHVTTYGHEGEKKKGGIGKGGLVAAGVGGVAVGALGAAALSGDSSDDEHHGTAAGYGAPASGGYYSSAPAPVALENNPNLSSSQRSSLESAREDLEEAQAEVRSGSASSSDIEELQEAREDYREEVEEAQEEMYDD